MEQAQSEVASIRDANPEDVANVMKSLGQAGIPSAMWGVSAAKHYGGGLCPLDIELIINGGDQERAFHLLTSQALLPSVPEDDNLARPTEFQDWRKLAPLFRFGDRRRTRLSVPIYEIPPTGDPIDDALLPFIILYSAETLNMPPLPPPHLQGEGYDTPPCPKNWDELTYSSLSTLQTFNTDKIDSLQICLIPSFSSLVGSEMHVLLQHADFNTPVWGQHLAQLSELLRSQSCTDGPDGLVEVVSPKLRRFAEWIKADLKGEADHEELDGIKEAYTHSHSGDPPLQDDPPSGVSRTFWRMTTYLSCSWAVVWDTVWYNIRRVLAIFR